MTSDFDADAAYVTDSSTLAMFNDYTKHRNLSAWKALKHCKFTIMRYTRTLRAMNDKRRPGNIALAQAWELITYFTVVGKIKKYSAL